MKKVQKRSTVQPLALAVGFMVLLAGCENKESPPPQVQGKTIAATVAVVNPSALTQYDEVPGSVIPDQQVQVASRLMGYIRNIPVNEGETVKAGQLLFTIDPSDIQGQVNQAQAGTAQADAALADAKADYERFTNLYKDESISRQQYEKITLMYNVAQSQATAAHAGLNTAQSQMHYAEVRAPIGGVITQKMASVGDLAVPGHPVLVLENSSKLQIQTAVSDDTFAHLKLGESVEVLIDGQANPVAATISRLVAAGDPMSHTHLVKLDLTGVKGLLSGSFARVRFSTGNRQGIRVPQNAVQQRAGINGVFVVDAEGIAHYRMVTVGSTGTGEVEIQAGLSAGERVVIDGVTGLNSGDRVSLSESTKP